MIRLILIATLSLSAAGICSGADQTYYPGPDDVLMILVSDHPELSAAEAVVSRSATVAHPVWGEISVEGMNLAQLQSALRQRLAADYVRDAHLTITLLQSNKLLVYLLAEMGVTNAYRLSTSGRLSELLIHAGVTPEICKRTMAVIRRRDRRPRRNHRHTDRPEGEPESTPQVVEVPVKTTVDLYELMILGRKEIDVPMRRNDWVRLVPRDPSKNQAYVFVIGDQNIRTEAYRIAAGTTLADVIRSGSTGRPLYVRPHYRKKKLKPNQFIIFGQWPAGNGKVAVFGDVNNAGPRDLVPQMTLGQVVAGAGLSDAAGSLTQIVLARRKGTTTRTLRFYLMSAAAEEGYGLKEPLESGDVLFVIGDEGE